MSASDSWCTPKWLTDLLGRFDLDPCSNAQSTVQAAYVCQLGYDNCVMSDRRISLHGDGLEFDWETRSVFVNPPYSDPLPWCRKLRDHNGPWCALLKLDPSTRWWAALMEASPTVAPFRKRLKFESTPASETEHAKGMTANFPSVLIYSAWRPSAELAQHLWLPTYAQQGRAA